MKINTDMSEAWMMYELSTLPKDYLDVTWLQKHSNSVTQEKLNMWKYEQIKYQQWMLSI